MDNTKEQLSVVYMEIAFSRLLEKCKTAKDISVFYGIDMPSKINPEEQMIIKKPKWKERSVCLYGIESKYVFVDFFSLFPNNIKVFGKLVETSHFLSKIDMGDR